MVGGPIDLGVVGGTNRSGCGGGGTDRSGCGGGALIRMWWEGPIDPGVVGEGPIDPGVLGIPEGLIQAGKCLYRGQRKEYQPFLPTLPFCGGQCLELGEQAQIVLLINIQRVSTIDH